MPSKKKLLWTLWQKYKQAPSGGLGENIDKKFAVLSGVVCAMVAADAARFSRLGDADKEIYEYLTGLMGVYERVMELSDEYSYDSPTIGALVSGICDILASRLREFEENSGEEPNPIATEKCLIVDETLATVSSAIDAQKKNFATGLRNGADTSWDESFEMILRGELHEMYANYTEGLQASLSRLDDLHNREIARLYMDMLEREWEVIGNIVDLQVLALEKANTGNIVVVGIIDALREARQQTQPAIENLRGFIAAPVGGISCGRSYEAFESKLLAALEAAMPNPPERKEFLAALDTEAMAMLDNTAQEYKKLAYTLQRATSADVLLAEEITRVFEKTLNEMPQFLGEKGQEMDILAGIRETIEIKIAGLQESVAAFSKQSGEIIKNFTAEQNNIPDEERQMVSVGVRTAWLEKPPKENAVAKFFEACRNGDIFLLCRQRVEGHFATYSATLEKESLRFKKEALLQEVCTYEEILTHSVARLRNSSNSEVNAIALKLDEAFRALEVVLKKNNIAVIKPQMREIFNAKEHEVLVAEKHADFTKGEIIKVVTAGYRTKERIILRANVIAAR